LQQHRDAWTWLLEPHWHEIGWLFEAAENTDQLCHVFEILNSLVNSELIAPFLRKSNEESTVGNVVRVREEHAQAIARLEPLERERREKHSNCEEIKLTVANLSQNAKQNLELDVTIRNGRIRSLRILRSRTQARLRKYLLLKNKSPNPKEICRDWTSYLEGKLRRIEKDIATDETAREESRKRLKWITVDNRKIAAEELDDRKKALARAETALNEASKMCDELQAKLLDQEAFIYRKELCDFIKSRKYAIEPRQIAKALAGLPYMKSRRSAERCLSLSCSIPVMSNYRVFSFVCSRWKRRIVLSSIGLSRK